MPTKSYPQSYVEDLNKQAQELIAAEKAGSSTDSFDFSATVCCSECRNIIFGTCLQVRDLLLPNLFKTSMENAPTHKQLCAENKRHMLIKPHFTQALLQFPWGRIEQDGTFNDDLARARFKVLGMRGFGFWSHNGSPRHYSDRAGWKLEPELIPFRDFSAEQRPPRLASQCTIVDWDSWYAWRGLSKESPAVLLMHFPMSVYWLLVHTLEIADPKAGSPDSRVQLKVDYIGAEVELNFLPLFAELALLLPYTNISLIMFGPAVHNIVSKAQESHPKSLAARASPTTPVFSYTAPEESGASRIQIFLHGSTPQWSPADADAKLTSYGVPDALVAPNAGLASYPTWPHVIVYAHQMQIPFATTEYAEQSCEMQRALFPRMVQSDAAHPQSVMLGAPGAPDLEATVDAYLRGVERKWEYPIEVNPFQRPGQRSIPTKLPSVPNGFTIQVVGKS